MKCYICDNKKLNKFLSLGHQPPSDGFLSQEKLNGPETFYPLDVYYCNKCHLVQLGYSVEPSELFGDYVYNTGTNNSLIKNFNELTNIIETRFNINSDDLAIDIGSNDGTLLKGYKKAKVLGVEPSSVYKLALKDKIPTLNAFFNNETANIITKEHSKAKIITATNVFAHIHDLNSIMEGIKTLLSENGVFIQESHYLLNLIEEMQWDSIYHEHLRYYSLHSLKFLFEKYGMELFDAEIISTHGGSIRTYACRKGVYKITDNIQKLMEKENSLTEITTFESFSKKVLNHKFQIQEMVLQIKKEGKIIVGIGAPAKGNTLLNYCNLTPQVIDYCVEKSDLKIGMYTPGMHIPVVEEKRLFEEQPEFGLMLSWNIASELVPKLKKLEYNGKFIIPLPKPHIE